MADPESVPEDPAGEVDISKQKTLELGEYIDVTPNRKLEEAFDSVASPVAPETQKVPGIKCQNLLTFFLGGEIF